MKHKIKDNFVFDPFFIVTALCCKTDRKVRILRPLGGGGVTCKLATTQIYPEISHNSLLPVD